MFNVVFISTYLTCIKLGHLRKTISIEREKCFNHMKMLEDETGDALASMKVS
jgi:hypothetical protein